MTRTMQTGEVKTTCPYCGVGCGFVLRAEKGRLTGLRPDPDHPVSRGTLCPKGATAHQFVHHPDRLTSPMLRRNGRLTEVGWDEAYGFVAGGLRSAVEEHGPGAVGLVSSARATIEDNYLAQKFARAVVGTNNVDNCFRICHSATAIGLKEVLGSGAMTNSVSEFLEPGPDLFMIVGSNTPHSHPIIWSTWIKKAVKRGAALIVIDPRPTKPARMATVHLKTRPGTEVALFNAMAHHILKNGLHDAGFVAARCENLDGLREVVAGYAPAEVEDLCGVPAKKIEEAAGLYARAGRASIVYGLGVTEHRTGVDAVQSLANLALLTGNVGEESAGINALRGQNNVQGATDMCAPEWLPGYQSFDDPAAVAKFEDAWHAAMPGREERPLFFSRMWEAALSGRLKALFVVGSDPALTEGNTGKIERALKSLELLVVQEVFPSRTTELAHAVLPSATFAEKDGTFVNTERRVQLVRKAVEPVGESKPDWLIFSELAERMGYEGMRYSNPEEIFEEIRRVVPIYGGMTYARLAENSGLQWPCPTEDHPGTPFLHAGAFARGRALLKGIEYVPPAEEPDEEYPLLLTTGRTFMQYNAGTMTRRTKAGRADPENFIEVNAADAETLGICDGEPVSVRTRRGRLTVEARITGIARGVVWMPFHFAEKPTNRLTNDALDPVCGITELKVCAAKVEPLRRPEGGMTDLD